MKVKIKKMDLEQVLALKQEKRSRPKKPSLFFRTLLKVVSTPDLKATKYTAQRIGMDKLKKGEPCLILMNHSSFIDLKIAVNEMYPRPMNIVTTMDGMVGLKWLLRRLGCFTTRKFVPDIQLVRDMVYCTDTLKTSVLMYPEAGYSFDGTTTTLPESLGKCVKLLGVPVVTIITQGAYARQPLFNNLRKRKVKVSAKIEYLLSAEQTQSLTVKEINDKIAQEFSFDAYRWQKENDVKITEPERAEGLERLLYQCPACKEQGQTVGKGTTLTCNACGKVYTLCEDGQMQAENGQTEFSHLPDWFKWQRQNVREQLERGEYLLEDQVDILVLKDTRALYDVGSGKLVQNCEGVFLYDNEGKLLHHQSPLFSHSLNADFFWYEIGDVICTGDKDITYCCFPKNLKNIVTKARFATEELYKLKKEQK